MLDADTKRRIHTARDILVGKVPDPKSQVEQITIALIYKFMDDIDAGSEVLGGKREFFAGDFARYGWAKLMQPGIGGHEMLDLYSEAIVRMPENPGIPPLFRSIFNNAYLPYRDPETLRAFLKTIDEFSYDHSERLGDAFEYLLSVLDSQGDAGQFRTPRHIIDFTVSIVDPRKHETILDPACGTAGFLISSYRHILNAYKDADGNSTLTPDDMRRLADNLKGYDISPDMVRLSLVNMYLHKLVDPHIFEYDTLTSEDRWDEYADVILANPPFMSPKGGIRPHNRFSIKAKRSEVLFVDYMAEHLTPSGRAGIIVPEGIIFQSQNAHKQLRKMLIEESLVAVVSLPGGVFNPYSGVKTSILILDKTLARRSDSIAFFRVENDGYDLGAQRRPISANDLPQVKAELLEYLRRQRSDEPLDDFQPQTGLVVDKAKIAGDGEYNLSGERYRKLDSHQSRFGVVPLGEVATIIAGQSPPGRSYNDKGDGVPFYQGKTEFGELFIGEPKKWTTDPRRFAESGDILMSVRAPVGPVNLAPRKLCIGRGLAAIRPSQDQIDKMYAFYILRSMESQITGSSGAAFASINKREVEKIEIPLPPLEVQKEIVAEIEGYQKVIDGARAVVENYRSQITVDPEWPGVELKRVSSKVGSGSTPRGGKSAYEPTGIPFIRSQNVLMNRFSKDGLVYVPERVHQAMSNTEVQPNDVLLNITGASIGRVCVAPVDLCPANVNQHVSIVRPDPSSLLPTYLSHFMSSDEFQRHIMAMQVGGTRQAITKAQILRFRIPLPPLETQQAIVAEIKAERALVDANRELITRFQKKIHDTINRVWAE